MQGLRLCTRPHSVPQGALVPSMLALFLLEHARPAVHLGHKSHFPQLPSTPEYSLRQNSEAQQETLNLGDGRYPQCHRVTRQHSTGFRFIIFIYSYISAICIKETLTAKCIIISSFIWQMTFAHCSQDVVGSGI